MYLFRCAAGLAAMVLVSTAYAAPVSSDINDYVPHEVIIKYKNQSSFNVRSANLQNMKAKIKDQSEHGNVERWKLPATMSVKQAVLQLSKDPNIEYAEPNYRRYLRAAPNDPSYLNQWGLSNTGQTVQGVVGTFGSDMNLETAWNITQGSATVIVAVIDDSVDITHPDLAANIWTNPGESGGGKETNGLDDDGNGYIDDVHGWDFKNSDNDPSADPSTNEGHGTKVAGCIGAVGNNGIGVTGVNWNVQIMPLKFGLDTATEAQAIAYAKANGAHIINASYGGMNFSQTEYDAVASLQASGVLFVGASGNSDGNNDFVSDYPAGFDLPHVLSVGGSDSSDNIISWAHYGGHSVDIAAPGLNIYTTFAPNTYGYTSGTSFSSPYVAGIAALIKANTPAATFPEMKGRILAGAKQVASMQGFTTSSGTADAAAALAATAAPVIIINDVTWGLNNYWPEPSEALDLYVTLENVWASATGVSAQLTSLTSNMTVVNGTANYPALATSAKASPTTPFSISIPNSAVGHQVFKFKLDITAAGYTVTRYYQIGLGNFNAAGTASGTLMTNAYDDFHVYHYTVPAGTSQLTFSTTSNSDVDLLVKAGGVPQFDAINYWGPGGVDSATSVSANTSGTESLAFTSPAASDYFLVVLDGTKLSPTPETNIAYTLTVTATPAGGGGGGGGFCLAPLSLGLPLMPWFVLGMGLLFMRRGKAA